MPAILRLNRLAGLLTLALVGALLLLTPARAQETPAASPPAEATPGATPGTTPGSTPGATSGEAVLRIEIVAPEVPVPVGDIIQARVVAENVEHLAGFSLFIAYDSDKLRPLELEDGGGGTPAEGAEGPTGVNTEGVPVQSDQVGAFVEGSGRGQSLFCPPPAEQAGRVSVICITNEAPVCLGGPAGASGSGVLAVIPFESKGGGVTSLGLTESTLALDDWADPCDPGVSSAEPILHTVQGASVELAPKDSASMLIIIIIVVAVVLAVATGGAFGYRWYRQRNR